MKAWYEKYRRPRQSYARGSGHLSTYPLYKEDKEDGEEKPIDFHFLENFHETNRRNIQDIRRMISADTNPLHWDPDGNQGPEWWPHLVVRLEEVYQVMKPWHLDNASPLFSKEMRYQEFFGILTSERVRLQNHFILINRKTDNDDAYEYYQTFKKRGDKVHNKKVEEAIKGYDVTGKLPTDITFASMDDFDEEQRGWAKEVEKCFTAWDTVQKRVNAFFVRWKTTEELEKEEKRLVEQVEPKAKEEAQKLVEQAESEVEGERKLGGPVNKKQKIECEKMGEEIIEAMSGVNLIDVLRQNPVHGFAQRLG
ncbi:hypothetical protein HD806DRAFT_492924 [Xylariaceae sp. AK1471]|nr:hypothetical protein HD806DRAFT_492924 [Xylariaceae sp. AK1471]